MSHRISLGIEGITGYRASSAVTPPKLPFLAILVPFLAILVPFLGFEQIIFGFHRVLRVSEGIRGFHRVSSAESASRHSTVCYVLEASLDWRAESEG